MTATELIEMLTSFVSIHGDCEVGVEMNIDNKNKPKCPRYEEDSKWLSIFNTHTEFVPFYKDDLKVIEKMACGSRVFTLGYIDTTDTDTYDCDNCSHFKLCTHTKGKSTIKE